MRLFSKIISILLFVLFFGLAIKNTQEASLLFFFGYEIRGPFVLILLGFFAAGAILSVICMTPMIFRNKRELQRKTKLLETLEKNAELEKQNPIQSPSSEQINQTQNMA